MIAAVLLNLYTSTNIHRNNERKKGQENELVYLLVKEVCFAVLVDWNDLDGCFTVYVNKCV